MDAIVTEKETLRFARGLYGRREDDGGWGAASFPNVSIGIEGLAWEGCFGIWVARRLERAGNESKGKSNCKSKCENKCKNNRRSFDSAVERFAQDDRLLWVARDDGLLGVLRMTGFCWALRMNGAVEV
jgi:hypothetical protein